MFTATHTRADQFRAIPAVASCVSPVLPLLSLTLTLSLTASLPLPSTTSLLISG